jgi:sugar/nucleoside kinase (ribokinase family)
VILCAGHAAYDINFLLDKFPKENRKYNVDEVQESSGGPAANAASLLARWGVPTALLAPLGQDAYGEAIRRDLAADGVVTALLQADNRYPTPFSIIVAHAENGSRTILTRKPQRPPVAIDTQTLNRWVPEVEGLVFDGHEPEASLALIERYPRAWSLLDAGTLRPGTELLARRVDYLVASENFTAALVQREHTGEPDAGLRALRTLSPRLVAFTRGEKGCLWYDPDRKVRGFMPALAVEVVDTTGAGDLFHGAFAYGLVRTGDTAQALAWATVAAGLSVRKRGGRTSIPTLAEVEAVLADRPCLPTLSVVD